MQIMRKAQQKRIAAGILGLLLLAVLLFAAFYIAVEAEHECAGEDCPICACMRLCEQVLTRTVGGKAVQTAMLLPAFLLTVSLVLFQQTPLQETPVSQKIRLNN